MERVKAIFDYVSDLQPAERDAVLNQVCGSDPELRDKVQRLIDESQADTQPMPPPPPTPGTTGPIPFIFATDEVIAGRHRVVRAIAKGGMGEVYEVEDTELGKRVALKTINLKSASRPGALEMFRHEISIAQQVTHPNVCRIYDIGHHNHPEHGEIIFLTMELLRGETLADRIRTSGPLTKEQAEPIVHQMVQALSAAHKLNIVHRDFKTGNVMLAEGASGPGTMVKVTDFGLARSIDGLDTTGPNEVWGTPDYMAPEQFRGQFSPASDIYAFGVVLYEIFSAKLPHRSSTGPKGVDGRESKAFAAIPAEWRPVVKKCMSYDPADRYATIEEVWQALGGQQTTTVVQRKLLGLRLPAAIAVMALLAISLLAPVAWANREKIQRIFDPLPEQKHIAVLPFETAGKQDDDVAFADGVSESLTSKLSQLERYQQAFWIVPYSDAKKAHSIDEAYRKLNTNLVITGSVRHNGDNVVLTANLVDAKSHRQLSSHVVKASVGNLDLLQNRLWESVADMVDVQVADEVQRRLEKSATKQPAAYDYYTQALGYASRYSVEPLNTAIELFSKAIVKDPNFALAYAGLGDAYVTKFWLTKDTQWIAPASANARKAMELDDRLPQVHITMGRVYEQTGQLDNAYAEYRKALEIDPSFVTANKRLASVYEQQGKIKEAEDEYRAAVDRRPGDWLSYAGLGKFYYSHGQFEKAATLFQSMIDLQPDNPVGYQNLGGALMQMGRYQQAVDVLQKGVNVRESPTLVSNLGAAYMFMGQYALAIPVMQKAVQLNPHDHELWRNLGDSYRQVPAFASQAPAAYDEALKAAEEQVKVNPRNITALACIPLYQAHLGQKAEAQKSLRHVLDMAPQDAEVQFASALTYELLGDRTRALAALQKAARTGFSLADIEREPELQSLHKDPRYQKWIGEQKSNKAS